MNYKKKYFYTKENKRNNFPKYLGSIYILWIIINKIMNVNYHSVYSTVTVKFIIFFV